jgi:hypothetical protein
MTDRRDGYKAAVPASSNGEPAMLEPRLAALANLPSPPLPAGAPALLANRVLIYLRPSKVNTVLPHVDSARSGLVLAGAKPAQALHDLHTSVQFPILIDPADYETFTATCETPFHLPGAGDLTAGLGNFLDEQMRRGSLLRGRACTLAGAWPCSPDDECAAGGQPHLAYPGRDADA